MSALVLTAGEPGAKWEVGLVNQARFSALSTEPVVVTVWAFQSGAPLDPTSGTVQLAFLATALDQPADADWHAAAWDTNEIGQYMAECQIGSGGALALAAGTWWVWIQVTLSPSVVVRQVGSIVVE